MTSTRPIILIICGCWHTPAHYQSLIEAFKEQGYESICPQLPTFAASPEIGLKEDVECIQRSIEALLEQGRDIVVAPHSYGGEVATNALKVSYSRKIRFLSGQPGGIMGIAFLCATILLPGESMVSALSGGQMPPFMPGDVSESRILTRSQ